LWTTEPPSPANATNGTNATTQTTTTTTTPSPANATKCVTVFSPLADESFLDQLLAWEKVAPEGSACVWGVDPRDERSHCIMSDGKYGVNGWCYTQMDQSEWGPCSDGCPLYGVHSVMGQEIDGVTNDIADIVDNLTQVEQMLPDPQRKKNQKGLAQTNATAVNTTSDAPNVTATQKGSELHAAALAQSGSVSARSGSRQASRHVQRSQRWRAAAWEEAASLAQTTVSDKRNTARAKLEEAVAFARKAKEQARKKLRVARRKKRQSEMKTKAKTREKQRMKKWTRMARGKRKQVRNRSSPRWLLCRRKKVHHQ